MYINPEIKAWLDQYNAQTADAPPPSDVPLEDNRLGFSELWKAVNPPPRPMHITDEIMIPGPYGDIRCIRYIPRESDELFPVLIFYHGRGTVLLSPDVYEGTNTALAAEADCIVIAPDYHLAPENPFPGPFEECYAVLNWTLQNAQTIGGDPNRVAIAGDSGGDYLTAGVYLEAKLNNTPQPIYQVIIYPMVDNAGKTASYTEMDYFLNEELMDWVIPYAFGDAKNRVDPRASPILAEDLSGLAPATVITANLCPLRDEGIAYANKLRNAGVPTLHYNYEGQIHGFFSFGGFCEESNLAVSHVAGILKHAFRAKAARKEIPTVM